MMLGRVQVPQSVRKGEPFEVRVLVQHPMETGFRRDLDGQSIPTHIVDKLSCRYGGREVFRAELGTGISANPYIAFYFKVPGPGSFEFTWIDDAGVTVTETTPFAVS